MAITVTAAQGGSTANGLALRVFVLTGAAATQNGATLSFSESATTAFTNAITTTQTGSRVYGASSHSNQASTAAAATTVVDDIADATNAERYVTYKATALTGTPGSTTLGFTVPASDIGPNVMAEIKTAGTLVEDGSAPAVASTTSAITVTTASFTPPAGSLLVALVGSDGGAAVTTMTVSDTSALTWTELVKNNASGIDYAGIWIAQVPAGGAAVTYVAPRTVRAPEPHRVPWQQKDWRDANTVATAANPLPVMLSRQPGSAWLRVPWTPQQPLRWNSQAAQPVNADPTLMGYRNAQAAALYVDRRSYPTQPLRLADRSSPAAVNFDTTLGGPIGTPWRRDPAAPRQQSAITGPDDVTIVGTGALAAWWSEDDDRSHLAAQRVLASDPLLLTTALLEVPPPVPAATWRRDPAPPQRGLPLADQSTQPAASFDPTLSGWAPRSVATTWPTDRRQYPAQRAALADQSSQPPPVFDPTLAGIPAWVMQAWPSDRRLVPQQRPVFDVTLLATALLENELLGSVDDVRRHSGWWPRPWSGRQADRLADQSAQPVAADPTLLAALVQQIARTWPTDRRLVPQQRPYVSDPSFYPTVPPTDPLTLAYGVGGTYWLMYNVAAVDVDRRLVPQQRAYVSDPLLLTTALLEVTPTPGQPWRRDPAPRAQGAVAYDPSLLAGPAVYDPTLAVAPNRQAATHAERRLAPVQRVGIDPALLTAALLENELLGSVDDLARHRFWLAARSGPFAAQFVGPGAPTSSLADPLLVVGASAWQRSGFAALIREPARGQQRIALWFVGVVPPPNLSGRITGGALRQNITGGAVSARVTGTTGQSTITGGVQK